tara:strand:- start:91 stop:717 length:627 start_codon:yes stop_codon:yes gene_type:complete
MKKTTDKHTLESGGQEPGASGSDSHFSRRRFTGAGLAAPVILSLASRPAFGAVCSPSGFVSYSPNNPSGVRHEVSGCGGISPGGWMHPDVGQGNSDGNRSQWYAAGYAPNPRNGNDPDATLFVDVFGVGSEWGTLHDAMLEYPGSLQFHAVAALLNASLPIPGYMSPVDVVGLYVAAYTGAPTYVTSGGALIQMADFDLKAFFDQTYH